MIDSWALESSTSEEQLTDAVEVPQTTKTPAILQICSLETCLKFPMQYGTTQYSNKPSSQARWQQARLHSKSDLPGTNEAQTI